MNRQITTDEKKGTAVQHKVAEMLYIITGSYLEGYELINNVGQEFQLPFGSDDFINWEVIEDDKQDNEQREIHTDPQASGQEP